MYISPPVNLQKYLHKIERSLSFSQSDYKKDKSLPKIIPFSESQKLVFMEKQKQLRKGQFFTFQMLEHYQEWLQFTLTIDDLRNETNIFVILRALPLNVKQVQMHIWTQIRIRKANSILSSLKDSLDQKSPKYYYYILSQIKEDNKTMRIVNQEGNIIRQINLYQISSDDYQRLSNFIAYYDRGNEYYAQKWTLRWRFEPPSMDQYDSFDQFYLNRVRGWDEQNPRLKRNLQMRLKFARYAAFIHVLLARGWNPKSLLNMDYFVTASLLKQYTSDIPLQRHIPFFKGIRFYRRILQNFYFHVDIFTSNQIVTHGTIKQEYKFGQLYLRQKRKNEIIVDEYHEYRSDNSENQIIKIQDQIEKPTWVTGHRFITQKSDYLRPEFSQIINSIPNDFTQIEWEDMEEIQAFLPKIQDFQKVIKTKVKANIFSNQKVVTGKNYLQNVDFSKLQQEDIEDQEQEQAQKDQEQEQEEKMFESPRKIKRKSQRKKKQVFKQFPELISKNGYVVCPKADTRKYVQCKCGETMTLTRHFNHACKNRYLCVAPSSTSFQGFIEFYRSCANRHYGLCLHCDQVISMDKTIQKSHPSDIKYSHSVLNYSVDTEKLRFHPEKLTVNRVKVFHSFPIEFKSVIQDHLQLPSKLLYFPELYPSFEYGFNEIRLSSTVDGMISQSIQKDVVFGPVGGNVVPSHIKLSQKWKKIQITPAYYWVPLCHYTLASLQVVGNVLHPQPNIRLIFAFYEEKIYAFWKTMRKIKLDELLVALPNLLE